MRIGRDKAIDRQSTMFEVDRLLTSTGACRSWVGDFFEELLADLTGATRIRTESGADICPDLRFNSECFFECKGIGQSGQGIMYQNRYEKDGRFIESNDVDVGSAFSNLSRSRSYAADWRRQRSRFTWSGGRALSRCWRPGSYGESIRGI